jgi:Cdc6-like AAA superfamily ATPase
MNGAVSLELWKLIVSVLVIVIGWGVIHWLSQLRETQNKRREIITGFLIEAYRNIERGCGRDPFTDDQKRKMEDAIADIQLFGSVNQIESARQFADIMNEERGVDPRFLLAVLRNDLRKELDLPKAGEDPRDIIHWRLQ